MPKASRPPYFAPGGCNLYFPGGKVYASDMPGRLISVATVHGVEGSFEFVFEDAKGISTTCPDAENMLRAISKILTRPRLRGLVKQQPNLASADMFDLQCGPLLYYVPLEENPDGAADG